MIHTVFPQDDPRRAANSGAVITERQCQVADLGGDAGSRPAGPCPIGARENTNGVVPT
jgi:hypothetical protein